MSKLSIHLPKKFRLEIKLVKSRKIDISQPIVPDLRSILRIRKGSKISRFFIHIFEHTSIKKILGQLILLAFVFSSIIVPRVRASNNIHDVNTTKVEDTIFRTETTSQYPLEKIRVTQQYRFYHRGVDLDGDTGDPIRPIAAGTVIKVENSYWGYGKSILVEHKSGTRSLYAHLSKFNVNEGDEVTKSTIIGEVGNTGRSFGDHLHLEIYVDGDTVDPLQYLAK